MNIFKKEKGMIKNKFRKKYLTKFEREEKNSKKSLLKSSVLVLTLLSLIMPIMMFVPSYTSNADTPSGKVKYKYTFDLGTENSTCGDNRIIDNHGQRYIYEIITYENPDGTGIELYESRFSKLREPDPNLDSRKTGAINLIDYLSNMTNIGEANKNEDGLSSPTYNALDTLRKIIFAFLDTRDDNPSNPLTVYGNYKYGSSGVDWTVYCSKNYAGTAVKDNKYSGYIWGSWADNKNNDKEAKKNFLYHLFDTDSELNPLAFYKQYLAGSDSSKKGIPNVFYSYEQNQDAKYSLYQKIANDTEIAKIVTAHIANGNALGFDKQKLKLDDERALGQFSWNVRKDSVDNKNATAIIDIFYQSPETGKKEHIYSFLYYKGAPQDKLCTNDKYGKLVYQTFGQDYNASPEYRFQSYDEPTGMDLPAHDLFYQVSKSGTTKMDPTQGQIEFRTVDTSKDEFSDKADSYADYNGKSTLFFANSAYTEAFKTPVALGGMTDYGCQEGLGRKFLTVASKEGDNVVIEAGSRIYWKKGMALKYGYWMDAANRWVYNKTFYDFLLLNPVLSIDIDMLDDLFDDDVEIPAGDELICGNWHLRRIKEDDRLIAYNVPASADEEECFLVMEFKKDCMKKINTVYKMSGTTGVDVSYKLHLKLNEGMTKETYSKTKTTYTYYDVATNNSHTSRYGAFLDADVSPDSKAISDYMLGDINLIKTMMKGVELNSKQRIYLKFYDMTKSQNDGNRGGSENDEVFVVPGGELVKNSSLNIVNFDITEWIEALYSKEELKKFKEEAIEDEQRKGLEITFLSLDELNDRQDTFLRVLFKYAKPVIMFLVFLIIIYTGIYSIMNNQDAKQRVLVKERLKHIVIAVIIFACSVGILFLCKTLMDSSFKEIQIIEENELGDAFDVPAMEYETNWVVNLIASFIDVIGDIFDWAIDAILKTVVGGTGTDLNYVVFNQGVNESDYDLAPFTNNEWIRYIYGYRALEALALALLAIAVIKLAVELIIHAGNSEKAAEGKQTILRICIAMLTIILAPFGVRLLLMLFNYLITLVPVRNIDLELSFADTGILGACARVMYAWTKFKIYLVFVVRKLMITFMLLITPLVMGLWAISEKFRSLSLWIGELVTNAATQFCYALVFFIAGLVMYTNQSDFVSLIIILLFMKLADFFKDSLQGLVQKWGGIDETGVAQNLAGTMVGWGKKAINTTKKVSKAGGSYLNTMANFVDPQQVSEKGRKARNLANIMTNGTGAIWGWQTKGDINKNLEKELSSRKNESGRYVNRLGKEIDQSGDDRLKDYKRKIDTGTFTKQDEENLKNYGDEFQNKINAYKNMKQQQMNYDSAAKIAKEKYKNSDDWLDRTRRKNSDELLEKWRSQKSDNPSMNVQRQDAAYNQASKSLAEKSADLDFTKQLFDEGETDEQSVVEKCKEAVKQASNLQAVSDGRFTGSVDTVKDQVQSILEDMGKDSGFIKDVLKEDPSEGKRATFDVVERREQSKDCDNFFTHKENRTKQINKAYGKD